MDLFPTILNLAQIEMPKDRVYDGTNLIPLLTGKQPEVRKMIYYYNRSDSFAIRKGPWKAHFITKPSYSKEPAVTYKVPLLYNLEQDPSEKYDVAKQHPEIIEDLTKEFNKFKVGVAPVPSIMDSVVNSKSAR
jgi:arylsulfatase A-like enzyme